jgi:hypothetical protein
MANLLASLLVSLGLDSGEFRSGLTQAQKEMRKTQKQFEKIGASMQSIGTKLTIGVTAPLALFSKGAVQAAIDAEEMGSAFNVVFGDMADDVRAWAEETGNAMGRSTQEMQRGALAFQELFGKSLAPEQAAEMSKQFAVLTQDLASFKNLSNEVAQQKLFAGLIGESEPLRSVGVLIDEASVKAKGLEMGLGRVNGELTQQEKIIARAALIQEQLSAAQGDVLRTSDSTANQIRRSQAAFEELQVTIGTKLLPVLTPLIEKLGAALEWFTTLPAPVQDTILVVAGLAAAFGPVLAALGSLVTIAPALATAFGVIKIAALGLMANPVILAFAVVLGGIYLAWQNWDKIEPILRRLYEGAKKWILNGLGYILEYIKNPIGAVTNAFKAMYVAVVGNSYVPDMVDGISREFDRLQAVMVDPARKAAADVTSAMKSMADNIAKSGSGATGLSFEDRNERLAAIGGRPVDEIEELEKAANRYVESLDKMEQVSEIQTVSIAQTFADMARNITSSLQQLSGAIRGGGFLDILGAVIGLGLQLGQAGLFGGKVQTNLNKPIPGFANGTNFAPGGLSLVGERGPELVNLPRGAGVMSNRELRSLGGSTSVQVIPSPYFDVVVDGRIMQSAPAIAGAGAAMAQGQMAARQARRVR